MIKPESEEMPIKAPEGYRRSDAEKRAEAMAEYANTDWAAEARLAREALFQCLEERDALSEILEKIANLFEEYNAYDPEYEDDTTWECAPEDRWRLGRDFYALLKEARTVGIRTPEEYDA